MSFENVYEKIAKENGTTAKEVKKEIEAAIAMAWNNPDKTQEQAEMQRKLAPNGEIPSADELIRAITKQQKSNN